MRPFLQSRQTLAALSLMALALLLPSCAITHVAGPSGPMYQAAKRQWLGSGLAGGGAAQNLALPVAVGDLRMAEAVDVSERTEYSTAISELEVIEHMPDADVTSQLYARWRSAQSAVDRFFKVPQVDPYNLPCDTVVNKAAVAAWEEEPANTNSGVLVDPLKRAVADLEPEAGKDACAAAAIDDLRDVESATKSEIANSFRPPCNLTVVWFEIAYLDAFFWAPALGNGGGCQA